MNWGFYIKQLRQEHGLTQRELSDRAGITRSHISNIERGRYKTHKPELIEGIAKALNMSFKQVIDCIYGQHSDRIGEQKASYSYDEEVEEMLDDIKLSVRRIEKRLKGGGEIQ